MGINQDEMWNSSWNNKGSVRKKLMNFSPAEHLSSACCCGVRTCLFRSFGLWFLVCLFMTLGPTWWLKDGHSTSLLSWIVTKMESQLNRGDQHHLSCKVKCVVFILASNGTLTVIKKIHQWFIWPSMWQRRNSVFTQHECWWGAAWNSGALKVDITLWMTNRYSVQKCSGDLEMLDKLNPVRKRGYLSAMVCVSGVWLCGQNFIWHLYPLINTGKLISEVNALSFVSQRKSSI